MQQHPLHRSGLYKLLYVYPVSSSKWILINFMIMSLSVLFQVFRYFQEEKVRVT